MNHSECFNKLKVLIYNQVVQKLSQLELPDLFLVGGAIRNTLLNFSFNDYDLIVGGDFNEALVAIQKVFNANPHRINTRFNTARFVFDGTTLDVTQINKNGIYADLNQRENTISAFALRLHPNINENDLIYPEYALEDLNNLVLRIPSSGVMLADPIRVLRVWRYAEEYGATVYPKDLSEISEAANKLDLVSRERVAEELWKALEVPTASAIVQNWYKHNVLFNIFPELKLADNCQQNNYHHLNVLHHSIYALEIYDQCLWRNEKWSVAYSEQIEKILSETVNNVSKNAITRLAILLHDIGKPRVKNTKNGVITFYEHDRVGAEIAYNIAEAYHFSSKQIELLCKLIKHHMRIGFLCELEQLTPRMLYRFWRALDDDGVLVILINFADRWASLGQASTEANKLKHLTVSEELLKYRFETKPQAMLLPLDGNDIMRLTGLPPGKQIGYLLKLLHEAIAIGDITTKEQAENFVKQNANNLPLD